MTLPMPQAAAAALLVEMLGVLAILFFLGSQVKEVPQVPVVTSVTLQPSEAPPVPKVPDPPVPKPIPVHKDSREELSQPAKQEPSHETEKKALPVSGELPTKVIQQARAAPSTPVSPEVSESFQSRVRAAVQDAVIYPMAARASHFSGRTRVGFTYLDGRASDIKVLVSSGSTLLDQAAMLAVKAANYPLSDKEYRGRLLSFQIWVRFLMSEDQE